MALAADDPEDQARLAAFQQGLQQLGWTDGRNVRIDIRWPAGDADRFRKYAAELVALAPDVILATGDTTGPLQQATHTVPIVFVLVADPVAAGYVASLARPGRNTTGFSFVEYSICGKWLELLKQIAPGVTRVAVLRDPTAPTGIGQFGGGHRAANRSFPNTHQSRNRYGLCRPCAKADRCTHCQSWSAVYQPSRSNRDAGDATCDSRDLSRPRVR